MFHILNFNIMLPAFSSKQQNNSCYTMAISIKNILHAMSFCVVHFPHRHTYSEVCCSCTGSYSCKQLSASFRPDVNFFATEVYGATFLLVALSWTGFWVDPRRYGGGGAAIRLGLGLFIVLILVVYGVGFRLLYNKVSSVSL